MLYIVVAQKAAYIFVMTLLHVHVYEEMEFRIFALIGLSITISLLPRHLQDVLEEEKLCVLEDKKLLRWRGLEDVFETMFPWGHKRIQNPVKQLRWMFLWNWSMTFSLNYFRKNVFVTYLTCFLIRLCGFLVTKSLNTFIESQNASLRSILVREHTPWIQGINWTYIRHSIYQSAVTCLNLTIETPEQDVNMLTIKTPERRQACFFC